MAAAARRPPATARLAPRARGRGDRRLALPPPRALLSLAGWVALIAAARAVGTRLYDADPLIRIGNPPLVGTADLHLTWWLAPAVAAAGAALAFAPRIAARAPFPRLLACAYGAALAWPALLALGDPRGPRALTAPLRTRYEYLHDVGRVGAPGAFLDAFAARLPEYATHVKGHPPGMLLTLAGLDALGLPGAVPATALILLVAALAAPAALLALRDVAGEAAARAAAPFVALAPAAVWIATSADGLFAGVGACGAALVVLATGRRDRRGDALALAGGLLLGLLLALTYGGVLLGAVPLAVALHRRRIRPPLLAAAGAGAVLGALAAAGFWWLDGLEATRALYHEGVAARRPYLAFLLIGPAALALATGPALAVALARLRGASARFALLPAGALAAVALADLSGMSRGETERIWLLFVPWLLAATAVLALASARLRAGLLGAQLALALGLQAGIRSPW